MLPADLHPYTANAIATALVPEHSPRPGGGPLDPEAIQMGRPDITEEDVRVVSQVLRSGCLSLGPCVTAFEKAVATYVGVEHAVAVSSGTTALHLIVKSLGLGARDEVLVPSFTFASSVNAILYEGARPVFVEMDPQTYNLDVSDLEHRITHRTRAIMAVDVFGVPADWKALSRFADRHRLMLIDDCCEALGAEFQGRKLGSFGDAGAFAFYPNKQITTGEGGMIVTDRADLAALARSYANQGRSAMGAWLEYDRMGYNYRMNEMSAALGASQLVRIEEILARRERVARMYTERLEGMAGVTAPKPVAWGKRSWFVYVVTLDEGLDRDLVIQRMAQEGIPSRGYFSPIHTQPYIRNLYGDLAGTLPVTEALARRTLALPFHNHLSEREIERVLSVLGHSLG
jgi:perosamine synthetase